MVNVRQFSDPRHRNSQSKGLGHSHTGGLMESIVSRAWSGLAGAHQAFGRSAGGRHQNLLELEEYQQRKAEPGRLGLAAEGQLPDPALDMPSRMRAIPEKDDVARDIAGRGHGIAFEHDGTVEDQHCPVEIIVPVEPAFAALPDHRQS